jgi:hypothetical protein
MSRKVFNYESKILVDMTVEEEGYHPDKYGRTSMKFIWACCRYCGKPHRIRKGFYNKSGSACHKDCKLAEQRQQDSPFNDPEVRKKSEQTNLKRYGAKQASQNKEIAQKISSTKQTDEYRQKVKKTTIDRYGVENVFQSEKIKEKIKKTKKEKYGYEHHSLNKDVRDKTKLTCLKKYGVDNPLKSEVIRDKIIETNIKRYGHKNPIQNKDIKTKQQNTMIKNHGVTVPILSDEIKNRIIETNMIRYGFPCPSKNNNIKLKTKYTFQDTVKEDLNNNFRTINVLRSSRIWDLMSKDKKSLQEICDILSINYGSLTFQLSTDEFKNKYIQHYSYPKFQTQKNIADEIAKFYNGKILFNTRKIIPPYELDIYCPKHNFAIEFNGSFWHSECWLPSKEAKDKHVYKTQKCREKGIRLFHIFENQWRDKQESILNFIKTILGYNILYIGGRECSVNNDECKSFIEQNHIQGYGRGTKKYFNLTHNNKIVAAMTASRHHRQNVDGNPIVLNRLCFKNNISVQGGSSKLFKRLKTWAKEEGFDRILSWSDNCWTEGNIYNVLGFSLKKEYGPDYFYWDMKNNEYKSKQSQRKKKQECPSHITEKKWCFQNGLYRIWDCGKKLWVYDLH